MAVATRSAGLCLVALLLLGLHGLGEGLRTSELGNEVAYRRQETIDAVKKMASTSEGTSKAASDGVRSVAAQLNAPENAELRKKLQERQATNAAERQSSRRSDGEPVAECANPAECCTAFQDEVLAAYTASYSADCGLDKFSELNNIMTFDLLLRSYPQFSNVPPQKPASVSWNELLRPFCTATDEAGTCGSSGFYASIKDIAVKYSRTFDETCTWESATISESPMEVLTQITEVTAFCLSVADDYCYPAYWETLGSFLRVSSAADPARFLANFIPQFCSPCARHVFKWKAARATGEDEEASSLQSDLLCIQVLGQYCYLELERLENAADLKEESEIWCEDLCMPILASKWGDIDAKAGKANAMHKKALRATYCAWHDFDDNFDSGTRCYEVMGLNKTTQLAPALDNFAAKCYAAPKCGVDTGFGPSGGGCELDISAAATALTFPPQGNAARYCDEGPEGELFPDCDQAFDDFIDTWGCCAETFLEKAVEVRSDTAKQRKTDGEAGYVDMSEGAIADKAAEYKQWFQRNVRSRFSQLNWDRWRCSAKGYDNFVLGLCDFFGPDDCADFDMCEVSGAWDIEATVQVDNLLYSEYAQEVDYFNNRFRNDLTGAIGLDSVSDDRITVHSGSATAGGGVQVEVSIEVSSWSERQSVLDQLTAFSGFNGTQTRRRSGDSQPEIFMLGLSQERSYTRADPFALTFATISNVRVSSEAFAPTFGTSFFNHVDVAAQCNETRSWKEILAEKKSNRAVSGGLGKRTQAGDYEVWVCLKDHACVGAVMAAFPEPRDAPFPGGVLQPTGSSDLMCFVFHEQAKRFAPWAFNSQLKLVGARKLEEMQGVSEGLQSGSTEL